MKLNRRSFNQSLATVLTASNCAAIGGGNLLAENNIGPAATGPLETFVPTRAITSGPKFHWFGYYDKREFDPTGRYVLSNEVEFEGRAPTTNDRITVGYVDTENSDKWIPIGTSNAWGWQQGCMLQWVGDAGKQIMWNDREGDSFVCRIYLFAEKTVRTIPRPIYTLSPDGRYGLSVDFRRIDNMRPGYGYDGLADPNVNDRAPEDSGIWRVDMQTGESKLIMSLADAAALRWPAGNQRLNAERLGAWHYFNHLLINPSGNRFIVLHRYRPQFDPKTLTYEGNFVTRMITANMDGSETCVLDPSGKTSHFIWKNDDQVTMWTQPARQHAAFYRFTDRTSKVEPVGHDLMPTNGHNTFLASPYQDWILNDTYPLKPSLRQTVFLYHVPSGRRVDLGHFPSPPAYRGEWRCDTHPRSSADGTKVVIDSPHDGGRQLYLLDVADVITKI